MKNNSSFELVNLRDWKFSLVLYGAKLQLEARNGSECWSAWMEPTENPREVAEMLFRRPSCCLI